MGQPNVVVAIRGRCALGYSQACKAVIQSRTLVGDAITSHPTTGLRETSHSRFPSGCS